MSIESLESAISSFLAEEADFEGRKPESLIGQAERYLGVTFPDDYREFLRRLGAGSYGAAEFYGIVGDDFANSSVPDAIWLTASERGSGMPERYVIVGSTGDGGWYAIDTDRSSSTKSIVELDATGRFVQDIAEDFGSFFAQMVAEENSDLA